MFFGEDFGDVYGADTDRSRPHVMSDAGKTRATFNARRNLQEIMRRLRQRMPFTSR